MKKLWIMAMALVLMVSFSLPAWAGEGAQAPGKQRHPRLSAEERAEYKKVRADYLNETLALRQQLAAKKVELKTLLKQPNPDGAKIKAVADEAVDLRAQIDKKRNEYLAKYPKYFGHHKRSHGHKTFKHRGPGRAPAEAGPQS